MSKRRKRATINKRELKSVTHLPQGMAAEKLRVSVTTLKKRYRELFPGKRWPYRPYNHYKSSVEQHETNGVDERFTLQYICHKKMQNPTHKVRRMWQRHIGNMSNCVNNSQGDDMMLDEDDEDEDEEEEDY